MIGHVQEIYNLYTANTEYSKIGKLLAFILVGAIVVVYLLTIKWRWLLFVGIPLNAVLWVSRSSPILSVKLPLVIIYLCTNPAIAFAG